MRYLLQCFFKQQARIEAIKIQTNMSTLLLQYSVQNRVLLRPVKLTAAAAVPDSDVKTFMQLILSKVSIQFPKIQEFKLS